MGNLKRNLHSPKNPKTKENLRTIKRRNNKNRNLSKKPSNPKLPKKQTLRPKNILTKESDTQQAFQSEASKREPTSENQEKQSELQRQR